MTGWQDSWTFRIVDQDTGAAVAGVPVSVLESGGRSGGYWVSESDGLVRIPKHDQPRLRLRVGLRNEEAIEFDARSLPDDTIPLTAPRDISVAGTAAPSAPAAAAPSPSPATTPGHLMRFARIGVLPKDRDTTSQSSHDPTSVRYGVLIEIELVWQSLGAEAGATLYSISLGPGEEVKLAISDGRWRKSPDARERPLQIVAKMVGARQIGDGLDAMPLDVCIAADLPSAAADTVKLLAERTARTCEALRRRALGVTELDGEKAAGATLRDARGYPLTDLIENSVVDRVGNYVAFPLRSVAHTSPEWRSALTSGSAQPARASQEFIVTLPVPGVWLRSELFPAHVATQNDAGAEEAKPEGRTERRKRG